MLRSKELKQRIGEHPLLGPRPDIPVPLRCDERGLAIAPSDHIAIPGDRDQQGHQEGRRQGAVVQQIAFDDRYL